jgi:hypothetical protein
VNNELQRIQMEVVSALIDQEKSRKTSAWIVSIPTDIWTDASRVQDRSSIISPSLLSHNSTRF